MTDFLTAPVDTASAESLAAQGLRLGLVDGSDPDAFAAWSRAGKRGFLGPEPSAERIESDRAAWSHFRKTGVWDGAEPVPVATVGSWPADVTTPPAITLSTVEFDAAPRAVTTWAISSVTVAPTHRRRGIARAMLEAELRTARAQGIPVASLTASEATIYGRYGFGPATFIADYTIDTRRARWAVPPVPGTVRFADRAVLERDARDAYDTARAATPGALRLEDGLWHHVLGLDAEPDRAAQLRAVRYDDADGILRGFAIYRLTEDGPDFTRHTAHVEHLTASTADAASALWRFLVELDLVATVKAPQRSVDEPFLWQLDNRRAVTNDAIESDFLWLRILDAPAAFASRGYASAGSLVLDIADPLGFLPPRILLETDAAGTGHATALQADAAAPAGAAHLALGAGELASLYLGGASAVTLARAGRVRELRLGSAAHADAMLRSPVTPWLGVMF